MDDIDCPSDEFHDLTAPTVMVINEGKAKWAIAILDEGSMIIASMRQLGDYAKPKVEVGAVGLLVKTT